MNVYDFDRTIYDGDSTVDFFLYSLKHNKKQWIMIPRLFFMTCLFFVKIINEKRYKEEFFRFLRISDADVLVRSFWEENRNKIKPWYIEKHRADDVVASASPCFILSPICTSLGIANVIATDMNPSTGKINEDNCKGEAKKQRFFLAFPTEEIGEFYSDSMSDSPMAAFAAKAFFVEDTEIGVWDFTRKELDKREVLSYLFFGFLTVLVNILSFALLYNSLKVGNVTSNILAWFVSVLFAFVTNRKFVFNSEKPIGKEFCSFSLSRGTTGVLDVFLMYLLVDVMTVGAVFSKAMVNILVIILNFVLSKLFVFKRKSE